MDGSAAQTKSLDEVSNVLMEFRDETFSLSLFDGTVLSLILEGDKPYGRFYELFGCCIEEYGLTTCC